MNRTSLLCLSAVLATGCASYAAEPSAPATATAPAVPASVFSMPLAVSEPLADVRYEPAGVSSSADPLAEERASLSADSAQPPTRRRYGRSRYQDRGHNPDGSNRLAIVVGAGLDVPVGNTGKFYTPHFDIVAGAGINFNRMFGVLGEFRYNYMNLTNGAVNYQYNAYIAAGATPDQLAGLDANAHIFSLTVNPIVNFSGADRGSKFGAYFTPGFGYYHKATNFTLPQAVTGCGSFFCQTYYVNSNISTDTADGFGADLGAGLTYKLSEFSSQRAFIEARYDWMKIDSANAANDNFPFNRRNTEFVPITVGLRW